MAYAQPAEPASGDRFDLKTNGDAWTGGLLLIYPVKVNEAKQWDPKYEATETVSADIAILDRTGPDGQPVQLKDSMIFAQVICAQLKGNLQTAPGEPVLGRLGKVVTQSGFDAWKLLPFNPGDALLADQWIAAHPRNAVQQPGGQPVPSAGPPPFGAAPAPAAAPDPWAVPAPAVQPPKDPGLVKWLLDHGVNQTQIDGMTDESARLLAKSFS